MVSQITTYESEIIAQWLFLGDQGKIYCDFLSIQMEDLFAKLVD